MQETSPDPQAGKAEWRSWLRQITDRKTPPRQQSAAICETLSRRLAKTPPCRIASFAALPDEPSLLELIHSFPQHRWSLPRVVGSDLVFHEVDHPEQLRSGAFSIAEPLSDRPILPTHRIDIFLCPGLGFDRRGIRLGRGKGFYDRALAHAKPEAERIGITFSEQLVDRLPSDAHDIPMTLVISGSGEMMDLNRP
ncbi:5-formyltetrahydrofolate cyclo-ligase [Haloferula sp.]|uniref:5-formyltetrahydrofolate cyclo-ligase n=1 Tax=Haloferula sp. TaxID=2497595 RepID=UPI003C77FDB3